MGEPQKEYGYTCVVGMCNGFDTFADANVACNKCINLLLYMYQENGRIKKNQEICSTRICR